MKAANAFDWREVPLHGRQLIEASAGTGKTYTLVLLVLRVLLETDVRIEQVVITTFTRAAAQELRLRLQSMLAEAQCALALMELASGGNPVSARKTSVLHDWLEAQVRVSGLDSVRRRLRAAELSLDRINIDTLHALCARILRDEPLAAPPGLDGDPLDAAALARECLEDCWRAQVLGEGAVEAPACRILLKSGFAAVADALVPLIQRGPVEFVPIPTDLAPARDAALEALRQPTALSELQEIVDDPNRDFRLNKAFGTALASLLAQLGRGEEPADLADSLNRNASAKAQHKSQHRRSIAEVPAMQQVWEFADLDDCFQRARRAQALIDMATWCRAERSRRARARDGHTFTDLIDATAEALEGADGDALATCLRARWPVALIDEFQDTDAQQYAICRRIWDAPGATLLLVGDPKQAIYAFRDADLHAYLDAAESLGRNIFRLATNYRSSASLIDAVNAFYVDAGAHPFTRESLVFEPVAAAEPSAPPRLRDMHGKPLVPLRVHLAPLELDGGNAGVLDDWCIERCADDIAQALGEGGPMIDGEPLSADSIAVLVPQHAQVQRLRHALHRRGIPCAGGGRASVFQSEAAEVLRLLLGALVSSGEVRLWRGVLASRLFGATLTDFDRWRRDAAAWQIELERATQLSQTWHDEGVAAMLAPLVAMRSASIVGLENGERLLADLYHLMELLASVQGAHAAPRALLAHLERSCSNASAQMDDTQSLRIDSDAGRVRLMTLHVSKGLEFDVVYLPFAWRMTHIRKVPKLPVAALHDEAGRLLHDLGSPQHAEHLVTSAAETQEEQLRLLYVALTRARLACHVFWASSKSTSEPATLDGHLARMARELKVAPGRATWTAFASKHPDSVAIVEGAREVATAAKRPPATPRVLSVRHVRPALPESWAIHSFSSITRHLPRSVDRTLLAPADDEEALERSAPLATPDPGGDVGGTGAPRSAVSAIRGREFGNALHLALQHLDWSQPVSAQEPRLRHALAESGVPLQALEVLAALVDRTLRTRLVPPGLRLVDIAPSDRIAELRFDFATERARLARWPQWFAESSCGDLLPGLPEQGSLHGMLTGSIDLVFRHAGRYHLLDYKSNHLGDMPGAYARERLAAAMQHGHYGLQMTLYQIALHRYLRQRLAGYNYGTHCGDALYLFVRGLDVEGRGVFAARLPEALIARLDADLAGTALP